METQKKLMTWLVVLILLALWMSAMWRSERNKVIDQQTTIDSLNTELFNANVEIGRHEITREEILKPNKLINKQYEEYYNHKTE